MWVMIGCNPSATFQLRLQLKMQPSTTGRLLRPYHIDSGNCFFFELLGTHP